NDKQGKVRQASIDRAALLVRALMAKYDIQVDRVLRHYDVTGKHCPGPMVDDPALWTAFRAKLTQTEQEEEYDMRYKYYDDMPDWAQPTVKKLMDKGYLKGEGDGVLNLSEDTLKVLVVGDRAGLYEA
ncbi:MAG: N-acetylmuramoyl-L-alanine amidase, partial [Butyricicoccus pullicaecorum]|nr:N-acetylmuramoyl-L-alanine amidase [Butyricicoccus pullicaecorum]